MRTIDNAPEGWPEGFTFLRHALMFFGSESLTGRGGWPYNKMERQLNEKAGRIEPDAALVLQDFSRLLQCGILKAAYSLRGGGRLQEMPSEWWFTTDPLLRYRTYSIDPSDPFREGDDLPCWIWVESKSLQAEIERRSRERNGWGPLISYEDWEASLVVPSTSSTAGRPDKTRHILTLFLERVRSGEVCERVSWEGAAIHNIDKENPDRATPKTIADRIRPYFNQIKRTNGGCIANQAEVEVQLRNAINGF